MLDSISSTVDYLLYNYSAAHYLTTGVDVFIGALFGACIGSFAGCAWYRIPRGISLIRPMHSSCPNCKHRLTWYENIPVFSFLIQRAKARCCGASLSPAYLINEILFALLGAITAYFIQA